MGEAPGVSRSRLHLGLLCLLLACVMPSAPASIPDPRSEGSSRPSSLAPRDPPLGTSPWAPIRFTATAGEKRAPLPPAADFTIAAPAARSDTGAARGGIGASTRRAGLQLAKARRPPPSQAPAGKGSKAPPPRTKATPVSYWGGPVMTRPINVYIIYYGDWPTGHCGTDVINTLVNSISDAKLAKLPGPTAPKWWRIVTEYRQKDGKKVSSQVKLAKTIHDNYSSGKWLAGPRGNNSVLTVLERALRLRLLPADQDGAYLVLTSADVKVGPANAGFCRAYCGWHTFAKYKGSMLKYGFAGNGATQCPQSTCNLHLGVSRIPGLLLSANMCWGPDGMATNVLHELAEIASDPYLNAWRSRSGVENADYCFQNYNQRTAWHRGTKYNLIASNGRKFLVQSLLDVHSMTCEHP